MANGTLVKYIAILCTSHKSKGIYSKALDKFNSLLSCTRLSDFWKSVRSKMFAKGCLSLFNYFIDMSPTLMSPILVEKTCFFPSKSCFFDKKWTH